MTILSPLYKIFAWLSFLEVTVEQAFQGPVNSGKDFVTCQGNLVSVLKTAALLMGLISRWLMDYFFNRFKFKVPQSKGIDWQQGPEKRLAWAHPYNYKTG